MASVVPAEAHMPKLADQLPSDKKSFVIEKAHMNDKGELDDDDEDDMPEGTK
jgi:hypothetical protein